MRLVFPCEYPLSEGSAREETHAKVLGRRKQFLFGAANQQIIFVLCSDNGACRRCGMVGGGVGDRQLPAGIAPHTGVANPTSANGIVQGVGHLLRWCFSVPEADAPQV